MSPSSSPVDTLDQLKELICTSLDTVKKSIVDNNDPALSLDACEQHPIHNRLDKDLEISLKNISSACQMLRALIDPNTFINDITYGYHDETALFVACQADIANLLAGGELSIQELASKTGLNEDKLARYMRNLCNALIFREAAENRFANNLLSITFLSEGKRALVGHCADECRTSSSKAWEALTHPDFKDSTDPRKTPFNLAYNTELLIFDWMKTVRPDIGQRCNTAMAGKGINLGQYLSLYPWASEAGKTIIDVGGGVGAGTLPFLQAHGSLRLKIQDLPESEPKFHEYVKTSFPEFEGSDRVEFLAHDFFTPQSEKEADIYFLRHVIHDWPDADAHRILSNCAAVMAPHSKLLILEHMISPTYRPDGSAVTHDFIAPKPLLANWGQSVTSRLDLQVLACLNAKQRTETEFRTLVAKAGLEAVRVWRNAGQDTILECRKA
ncbi:S-adenosyl-L-methionine-dependent methyltransferase [Penicillium paradoxum]|uniref:S-adenosyl-L-methionine-dependent methyltransferase n=1 Tax=Penicillium paradoxum TaxID=176176 RepID=UPI0025489C89|nr:S-adenosyl-L-methionine-dependent methyltransferase [Penicillium paradoxum]KAJ5787470.1 S-adenosyl-L-methionine-dependent methyltransferase [Penicillium paradoxum]